jgi:hypothetical protein
MQLAYRMDIHNDDELYLQRQFGESGVFLPFPGSAETCQEFILELFGDVPMLTWPGRGAWVDSSAAGMTPDEALDSWGNPSQGSEQER